MNKTLEAILNEAGRPMFVVSVSYVLQKGVDNLADITDEDISEIEETSWATASFLQNIVRTGREIAIVCKANPLDLIKFCQGGNLIQ